MKRKVRSGASRDLANRIKPFSKRLEIRENDSLKRRVLEVGISLTLPCLTPSIGTSEL